MSQVNSRAYLNDALFFGAVESAKLNFYTEWLPDEIIDCHAHCNLLEHVGILDGAVLSRPLSSFPDFSLVQSARVRNSLYPGKRVRTLRFANPYRGIDHRSANQYLLTNSPASDAVAIYGIPNDVEYTIKAVRQGRVSALKMYYMYFNPPVKRVYDFFRPEILEEVQDLGLPIILHLPHEVVECLEDVLGIVKDFPRLTIVLAHMGLTFTKRNDTEETFRHLSVYEKILFDTSSVSDGQVIAVAIKTLGVERVMFGTDEPLNLLRVKFYKHPELGHRLAAGYNYHWVNPAEIEMAHISTSEITHLHWQTLDAIATATDSLPPVVREKAKELIFFKNAKNHFGL